MSDTLNVIVVSPEEAYNGTAEFWRGPELVAVTTILDGQLHLRIDPRLDGRPWLIHATSLALGLGEAARKIAAF